MNARPVLSAHGTVAALLLASCSSSPTAGGGSDMPNGMAVVSGTVVLPDSTPASYRDQRHKPSRRRR